MKGILLSLLVGGSTLVAPSASAYSNGTHRWIAQAAVNAMVKASLPRTANGHPPEFATYLRTLSAVPDKLSVLKVGLPSSQPGGKGLIGNTLPDPIPADDEPYPFPRPKPATCPTFPDDNLNLLDKYRIKDFRYDPQETSVPCGLVPDVHPNDVVGAVFGFHAQSIDDHFNDSILWYRPINAGWWGAYKDAMNRIIDIGLGALLAPFVCGLKWLTGDSCDVGDINSAGIAVNPVRYVESLIPGWGTIKGGDYTGLWHFIDLDANINQFNDPRGMLYWDAGPGGLNPGEVDLLIGAGSQLAGISVNPYAADGVKFYGKYDQHFRNNAFWMDTTLLDTEFSSLDNLAHFGWDAFLADSSDSSALAWPLHAIGDACEPHHIVGTTAWGHRPYEWFVDAHLNASDPNEKDPILNIDDDGVLDSVLTFSQVYYDHWDGDVAGYIRGIAQQTRDDVTGFGDDTVYKDAPSSEYRSGDHGTAAAKYEGMRPFMRSLLVRATAATVAFLARAAERAVDPGLSPAIKCPPGWHYNWDQATCVFGPTCPAGQFPSVEDGHCTEPGTGGVIADGGGLFCLGSTACGGSDAPSHDAGVCRSGVSCTIPLDCPVSSDRCVSGCCVNLR
ncbi:MAG TPA: hypothetical protein VHE30_16635 [Polyangiaceae bacterium]|nr:hypothetical protein [Polyangiaceae bacterium]